MQNKTLHEVWEDPKGLTGLALADERGDEQRKLMEPGSRLIHTFYADSHFEAMTIYYEYMGWGVYTTMYEQDKLPYSEGYK